MVIKEKTKIRSTTNSTVLASDHRLCPSYNEDSILMLQWTGPKQAVTSYNEDISKTLEQTLQLGEGWR